VPFLFHVFPRSGALSLSRLIHFYLQKLSPIYPNCKKNKSRKEYLTSSIRERAWKIPSFAVRDPAASMTIEASLCLTVFLIFMVSLCQLFLVMQLQLRVQRALEQVGNEAAQYTYLSNQVSWWDSESQLLSEIQDYFLAEISEEALRIRFLDVMGQDIWESALLPEGTDGVSLEESRLLQEHHRLNLVVTYKIRLPVTLLGVDEIALRQQCYRYALLGDKAPSRRVEKTDTMVYVTKHGEVYHTTLLCTYLNLSVRSVSMSQVGDLRNDQGACYYACELCEPTGRETAVYLTSWGDRYHKERGCSGIQRYITSIPLEEASHLRECSRCGKGEE